MLVTNCLDEYFSLIEKKPELFAECAGYPIVKDREIIEKFQLLNSVQIGVLYRSAFNTFVVDLIDNGQFMFTYERIIPTANGKGVVCIPAIGEKFVLLKQHRHAIRTLQICFPRGFGENDLSSESNARKELFEEIGAECKACDYLGSIVPDSGLSSTICDVYLCKIESFDRNAFSEGIIDADLLSVSEIESLIQKNMIDDSFTLSAFVLLKSKNHLMNCGRTVL